MRGAAFGLILYLGAAFGPATAETPERLVGHGGPVMDVTVAGDGRIATASFDNSVGLWTGGAPDWLEGHAAAVNTVIFTGTDTLASGGDDFSVILWRDGAETARLDGHRGKVAALALSPDGATLASASWDGSVGLWSLGGGAARFLTGHGAAVNDVLFGDDGTLYSAGADGTIRVWDPATGEELRVIARHGFGINRMVLGPGWLAYGAVDGGTRLISPATGALLADFTADRRPILALAHAPGAGLLAVGDGEGYVMVIDIAAREIVHDFRAAAQGPIWALDFGPDGRRLYAAGLDAEVASWPVDALGRAEPMPAAAKPFQRDPAEMDNGERQFQRKCSICHSLVLGSKRKAGPTLHGLFGRPAGSVAGYAYSEHLDRSDIVWGETTIDALFDLGPDHYIPGSKMPMQRIADPRDRADLVAFLRDATATEGGTR